MAMIKTMKGEKSNFQINAMNIKPNCNQNKREPKLIDMRSFFIVTIT